MVSALDHLELLIIGQEHFGPNRELKAAATRGLADDSMLVAEFRLACNSDWLDLDQPFATVDRAYEEIGEIPFAGAIEIYAQRAWLLTIHGNLTRHYECFEPIGGSKFKHSFEIYGSAVCQRGKLEPIT